MSPLATRVPAEETSHEASDPVPPQPPPSPRSQHGASLLEVLIALLIFSFGVLGIVGLQANMNIRSTEARQRAEAAVLANEIIGRMWIAKAIDRDLYQYRENLDCEDDGTDDPQPVLASWLEKLVATIPGAQARIAHDEPTGETELVICWQRPHTDEWSQHVVHARINANN